MPRLFSLTKLFHPTWVGPTLRQTRFSSEIEFSRRRSEWLVADCVYSCSLFHQPSVARRMQVTCRMSCLMRTTKISLRCFVTKPPDFHLEAQPTQPNCSFRRPSSHRPAANCILEKVSLTLKVAAESQVQWQQLSSCAVKATACWSRLPFPKPSRLPLSCKFASQRKSLKIHVSDEIKASTF